jgi:IstB-like ATP binding protein
MMYASSCVSPKPIDRERRMIERRIRAARFPAVKSFDTFDFTAIRSVNKPLTLELARCEYSVARENIIALGNSGTSKTPACLALGLAACQRGLGLQRHCFPSHEDWRSPSEIAGGGPTASGAPLWPLLYGARAYRLHSPCPSALHRAHHGSGCTARACVSRLPSTAELFGRNTPVS